MILVQLFDYKLAQSVRLLNQQGEVILLDFLLGLVRFSL